MSTTAVPDSPTLENDEEPVEVVHVWPFLWESTPQGLVCTYEFPLKAACGFSGSTHPECYQLFWPHWPVWNGDPDWFCPTCFRPVCPTCVTLVYAEMDVRGG